MFRKRYITKATRNNRVALFYSLFELLQEEHIPHAPQFPPQEQEGLPFFFFIISFAITAIKSIAITAVMIIVITVPFVIVGFIFLMQPSDFHPKIRFFDSNKDFCERP